MDIRENLEALASKVRASKDVIETEEAAKNAFVLPFLAQVLGYDVFNPLEVIPEFTADVGVKKGEKVDYAIVRDGEVQILVECKKISDSLDLEHASQLYRYFGVTNARIAVLTNGQVYQIYTDLDQPNRMDSKPFLVLDLLDLDSTLIPEISKLSKEHFDLDSVIGAAEELMYLGQIKREIVTQFREPSEEWIRFFTARVYNGSITQKVREQFGPLVAKAASQFLNEQASSRLKSALESGGFSPEESVVENSEAEVEKDLVEEGDNGIVTTAEELEGFRIVRAIACSEVAAERIVYRDSKSYFAILLDDNNRKPVARLHFNGKKRKFIGFFDADKNETRVELDVLEDIYQYGDEIRTSVRSYL